MKKVPPLALPESNMNDAEAERNKGVLYRDAAKALVRLLYLG